jgi:hypothetical protein
MEDILFERSEGAYGMPALQGMLTASVVGPGTVPLEWILKAVLSPHAKTEGARHHPYFEGRCPGTSCQATIGFVPTGHAGEHFATASN